MQIELTEEYLASQGLSKTFPQRFWKKVNKNGPTPNHMPGLGQCWEWFGSANEHGYGHIQKGGRGGGKIRATHAALILFGNPVPEGKMALHRCDNPKCVNFFHLFTGTQKDNIQDAKRKGRMNITHHYGERQGGAKLKDSDIPKILKLLKDRITHAEIATMFGVARRTITHISCGTGWKKVIGAATIPTSVAQPLSSAPDSSSSTHRHAYQTQAMQTDPHS